MRLACSPTLQLEEQLKDPFSKESCQERAGPQHEVVQALDEEVQWICGWNGVAKYKVVGEDFDIAEEGRGARRMSLRRACSSCLLGALMQP